jgi:hypothetical protein
MKVLFSDLLCSANKQTDGLMCGELDGGDFDAPFILLVFKLVYDNQNFVL